MTTKIYTLTDDLSALYPQYLTNLFPRYIVKDIDGNVLLETDRSDFAHNRVPLAGGAVYDRQQLNNVKYYGATC